MAKYTLHKVLALPTTLESNAIYYVKEGITEFTQVITDVNGNAISSKQVDWSEILNTPTTIAGYGITDTFAPSNAEANIQSDWNAATGDAFILNKPIIPTNNNQLTNGANYITGVSWTQVTAKPTTFTPSTHSHSEILGDTIVDLNTIPDERLNVFTYDRYSASALNKPVVLNNANGVITMQSHQGTIAYGKQIAFGGNDDLYIRQFTPLVFRPWFKLYHSGNLPTYDNYQSWNLKTNGIQRTTIQSGGTLDIVATNNLAVTYGAGGVVNLNGTHDHTFASLTSKPATISGYGITDAYTKLISDGKYSLLGHIHSYNDLTDKPALAPSNAEQNVNTDWNATVGDALILNKPTIPTNNNQLTNGAGYITGLSWTQVTAKPTTFTPSAHTHNYENPLTFTATGSATVNRSGNTITIGATAGTGADGFSYISSLTFSGGLLTAVQSNVTNQSISLDGRYSLLAHAHSWTDITGKPTIPTNNNQLTNGEGFIIASQVTENETDPTVPSHVKSITTLEKANWTTGYNKRITGLSITGTSTKTVTLTLADGTTVTGSFTDISSDGTSSDGNDYVTGGNFNSNTGEVTLTRVDGGIIVFDLDGRYEMAFAKNNAFNSTFGTGSENVIRGNDSRLSDARPASDVYAWAKATVKPSYTYSEIGAEQSFVKNTAFNKNFGTTAGTVAEGHSHPYDNYASWRIQADGGAALAVVKSKLINLAAGANMSITRSGDTLTFEAISSGTGADGNNYITGATFNTSTGWLTITRQGLVDVTENFDGRYEMAFNKNNAFNSTFGTGSSNVIRGNDTRLSNSRPASDVYTWAKAISKPSYTYAEVGAEQAFNKNTAFNKNFSGNGSASTVSRSDHTHAPELFVKTTKDVGSTTYILKATDKTRWLSFNVDCTVTVPTGLSNNDLFEGEANGSIVTFTKQAGVTLRKLDTIGLVLSPNGVFGVRFRTTDNCVLYGTDPI